MRWQQCYVKTGRDPYVIYPEFLKRLSRFDDGRVRLRWSPDKEKWIVERKVAQTVQYVKLTEYKRRLNWQTGEWYEVPNDLYLAAKDGYMIIDYIDPRPRPSDWLIRNLQFSDIRRWGGSKEFVRKLEAFEAAREERKQKAQRSKWKDLASEQYDHLKRRYGEQAFVPRNYNH